MLGSGRALGGAFAGRAITSSVPSATPPPWNSSRAMRSRPIPRTSNRPSAPVVQVFRPPGQSDAGSASPGRGRPAEQSPYRRASETCFFIHRARGQHGVEVDPVLDLPDRSDPYDHPGDWPALRIQDTPADGHVVPDQPQRHLAAA